MAIVKTALQNSIRIRFGNATIPIPVLNYDLSNMDQPSYKLDRSAFEALSFKEADDQMNRSTDLTWNENIRHFNYLMGVAFGFLGEEWPQMDKSTFAKINRA